MTDTITQLLWLVSGQSAFWTLIPAALSVVIQPSGRVSGLSTPFGPFLRSSPVFCAFSTIDVLVHLISHQLSDGLTFRQAAKAITQARIAGEEDMIDENRFRSPVNITFRWLLFLLGVILQSLRIMALRQQIQWTVLIWAFCYFISFLLVEVLFLLGGRQNPEVQKAWTTSHPSVRNWCVVLAFITQGVLTFTAVHQLWNPWIRSLGLQNYPNLSFCVSVAILVILTIRIFAPCLLMLAIAAVASYCNGLTEKVFVYAFVFSVTSSAILSLILTVKTLLEYSSSLGPAVFELFAGGALFGGLFFIFWIALGYYPRDIRRTSYEPYEAVLRLQEPNPLARHLTVASLLVALSSLFCSVFWCY